MSKQSEFLSITVHIDGVSLRLTPEQYKRFQAIEQTYHDSKRELTTRYNADMDAIVTTYMSAKTAFLNECIEGGNDEPDQ